MLTKGLRFRRHKTNRFCFLEALDIFQSWGAFQRENKCSAQCIKQCIVRYVRNSSNRPSKTSLCEACEEINIRLQALSEEGHHINNGFQKRRAGGGLFLDYSVIYVAL